jgi:hypothetical protein
MLLLASNSLLLRRVAAMGVRGYGSPPARGRRKVNHHVAITVSHSFAISPRISREFCSNVPPSSYRGRRECRAPDAPAASRVEKNTRVSHHGHAGSPGIPRAVVLTAYFALSPVTGLSCHRHPQETCKKLASRELDASVGASGPHDFAVRKISAFVNALLTSTASRPASVTIASRPSVWDGTVRNKQVIWVKREWEYFCEGGWTLIYRFARRAW